MFAFISLLCLYIWLCSVEVMWRTEDTCRSWFFLPCGFQGSNSGRGALYPAHLPAEPSCQGWDKRITGLKPAWVTYLAQGQPGLHLETLHQNQTHTNKQHKKWLVITRVISRRGRLRQKDQEFKVTLGYRISSKLTRDIWNPVSKTGQGLVWLLSRQSTQCKTDEFHPKNPRQKENWPHKLCPSHGHAVHTHTLTQIHTNPVLGPTTWVSQ